MPLARCPPPPLPLTLDGNDDDTRLINYPRRGFKWRPPPNGGWGGRGRDDPFEREKTFFLPINPNYRLSRRSRRPREEVRELACHSGKNRIFHEWPNSRNNGSEIVKGFSFFFFFFCSKLFINRGTVDIITIYMYRLASALFLSETYNFEQRQANSGKPLCLIIIII